MSLNSFRVAHQQRVNFGPLVGYLWGHLKNTSVHSSNSK